jgi:hypothetical protein
MGLAIRRIIAPPPVILQKILPKQKNEAVRAHYWKTKSHKHDEILAEKLDNVRNFKTHAAKMQNAFSIGTASGIPITR